MYILRQSNLQFCSMNHSNTSRSRESVIMMIIRIPCRFVVEHVKSNFVKINNNYRNP